MSVKQGNKKNRTGKTTLIWVSDGRRRDSTGLYPATFTIYVRYDFYLVHPSVYMTLKPRHTRLSHLQVSIKDKDESVTIL